jgi:hypothetical protein
MNFQGENMEMNAAETWQLEDKESVLKIMAKREGPMGVMESIFYLNRSKE